ncbi:copper chaperone [Coniosporium tulheliwenetii]|uniref:Copper chaperone n=1 Tax=Coniosporium tulheliwenetii TaxID=3383036 RepID=A0ACC2ZQ95_9PEZI|nr:copper chaperone [Cladosporium sp. JES 115]
MIPPFQTTFAVPLSCEDCIKDVSTSLYTIAGINKVDADLKKQLISVEGTAAPSAIVAAIQATGRDAILRGSGRSESAAVCILETHSTSVKDHVRGLIRMVQVSSNMTIIDLSIRGLSVNRRHLGSSEGEEGGNSCERGFGTVEVGKSGIGTVFLDKPIQIWEMIGRSIVVSRQQDGKFDKNDPDTLVGVIARSAGVWDNDKTVCSCSGKTVWEERKEQVDKGML